MAKNNEKKRSFGFFGNLSLFFVDRPRFTAILMISVVAFGALSYTHLIRREGFPSIDIPVALVQGGYFVNDATAVDEDVAIPLQQSLSKIKDVDVITSNSSDNSVIITATLKNGATSASINNELQTAIDNADVPKEAKVGLVDFDIGRFFGKYNIVVSLYSTKDASAQELEGKAKQILPEFLNLEQVESGGVESLYDSGINPDTGEKVVQQVSFAKIGLKDTPESEVQFFSAAVIGLNGSEGDDLDIFELSENVNNKIDEINETLGEDYRLVVSADFTSSVEGQISSLQNNVVTGIIAILLVSTIIIGIRVSGIMAVFVLTVLAVTVGVLYLLGFTLNTITLFSLVLALGLFVDDATIISEAIDAHKRKLKGTRNIIGTAVSGVGSASFAGTATTILVFAPLLFISGILGEIIVAMPITIIISLLTSLILSLTLMPFLAQYTILTKKNIAKKPKKIFSWPARVVDWISRGLSQMIRKIKTNKKIGLPYAFVMFGLSIVFMLAAGYYASRLGLNIFPSSKDSDQLTVVIEYDEGIDIVAAQKIANEVNGVIKTSVGEELVSVNYSGQSLPSVRSATMGVDLTQFRTRDIKAPQIIANLEHDLDETQIAGANITVTQLDVGPQITDFPFAVQIHSEDDAILSKAADDMEKYLSSVVLELSSGDEINVVRTNRSSLEEISRRNGRKLITVGAGYDSDDVSQILQLTRDEVRAEYTPERLKELGLSGDQEQDLGFDFGQESENEESFASLGPIALISLVAMFILLLVQFRSVVKPILIFLAIPFSLLGVTAGLYYTDNSLSFFAMIGLIGLIGIVVNNTILLVDAANRFKKKGDGTVDAIADGLHERFRPLITTTLTTVVALTPLAISDPFWEPLAVTIIFGLVSSTILVIMSFPFYYIAVDAATVRVKRMFEKK